VEKMENALFANVKKLYDHKLYECVIPVVKPKICHIIPPNSAIEPRFAGQIAEDGAEERSQCGHLGAGVPGAAVPG